MNALIKVSTNEQGSQVVSAKELYGFLEVKERFSKWFERQLQFGFILNQDYTPYQMVHPLNNQESIDYVLTLDTAKEIAMLQRSEKGKQARQYFIECEKQLKAAQLQPVSIEDVLIQQLQITKAIRLEQEQMKIEQESLKERILLVEAKSTTRPEYFTVMGYAVLKGVKVSLSTAAIIGKKAKAICTQKGYHVDKITDPRFGRVGVYPTEVLTEVFNNVSFT